MEFALEIIVKASLILLLLISLLFIFRKASAALHHWVISVGMIALLLLPALNVLLPAWHLRILPPAETPTRSEAIPTQLWLEVASIKYTAPVEVPNPVASFNNYEPYPTPTAEAAPLTVEKATPWTAILFAIWLLGMAWVIIRMLVSLLQLEHFRREATLLSAADTPLIGAIAKGLGIKTSLSIYQHHSIRSPMTWNNPEPIILLPAGITAWKTEEFETVLLHEMAHIRRNDFYFHLLGQLVLAAYWFHPLLWWINRRFLLEREKACDEMVIHSGVDRADYAAILLAVAKRLVRTSRARTTLAVTMAQPSMVKQRIIAALGVSASGKSLSSRCRLGILLIGLLALPLLAAVNPRELPVIDHFPILQKIRMQIPQESTTAVLETNAPVENGAHSPIPAESETTTTREWDDSPKSSVEGNTLPDISIASLATVASYGVRSSEVRALEFAPVPVSRPQGLYGQWQEGRSQFTVWVKGDFDLYAADPYIAARTPEDMIIIQEVKGGKTYRLVISRAAFDGGLIQTYLNGQPNSWSGIPAGENLYLWTVDGEWKFLAKGLDRWKQEKLEAVMIRLRDKKDTAWQSIGSGDDQWSQFMASQEAFMARRFVPRTELPKWGSEDDKLSSPVAVPVPELQLHELPVRTPHQSSNATNDPIERIGNDRVSRVNSGWSGTHGKGMRYGVLINKPAGIDQLTSFQFHLAHNLCRNATLQLFFYEVEQGRPVYQLSTDPVYVETGDRTGWISKDLRDLDLHAEGDVLAVIEVISYEGNKREKGGLFFSQSSGGKNPSSELTGAYRWDFTFVPLAAYFEISPE
ncbi:M56 family metallopeptidase [Flavilitoribacter nigricans]|nr:M56 family metallopeptidase [Flavilitoribacter nigricans]